MARRKDFIVIKSFERSRFLSDKGNIVYAIVTAQTRKGMVVPKYKDVTKEEAMDIVKENGLIPVVTNKYGTIWDTPNENFKDLYKGIMEVDYD